jgi:hypothetical protein
VKLAGNIIKNPKEEKFRNLNKANNTIKAKVMCFEGITQIILAMGYTNVDESFFKYEGDALWTLKAGIKIIKAELEPIELKYMS